MKIKARRSTISNRVLIVDNEAIMGAGLEKLLSEEPSIEVFGTANKSETTLVQEIWYFQPDIIILTSGHQGTSPTWLLNLLNDYGSIRIILINADNNDFEVYDRKHVTTIDQATLIDHTKKIDEHDKVYELLKTRV